MDEKFVGNEGYDPDAMLGIDSAAKSLSKGVKKALKKKNTQEDGEEKKAPQKRITEIKVSHITKEEIERKRNGQTDQIGPSEDKSKTDNTNEKTNNDNPVVDSENGEIIENKGVEEKNSEKSQPQKKKPENKGNTKNKNEKENKNENKKPKGNTAPKKSKPKLSETAKEVDLEEFSSSGAINEAEEL